MGKNRKVAFAWLVDQNVAAMAVSSASGQRDNTASAGHVTASQSKALAISLLLGVETQARLMNMCSQLRYHTLRAAVT